ncbi:MAG TPA: VanW family protein [Acidimicrobiales bacterium]
MGGAAPHPRRTHHGRSGTIDSDGKPQGIAGHEDQGPTDLDATTTADHSDTTTGDPAGRAGSGAGAPGNGSAAPGPNGQGSEEPAVTTQMEAIDAPAPVEEPSAPGAPASSAEEPPVTTQMPAVDEPAPPSTEPGTSGTPGTTGSPSPAGPQPGPSAGPPVPPGLEEPAVTTQMPVVDAPLPPVEPTIPSGERPAAIPSGERPAAFPSGERPAAGAYASGERPAAYASGERPAAGASGERPAATADGEPSGERPRHLKSGSFKAESGEGGAGLLQQDLPRLLAIAAAPALLVLLILAWAVDTATHSGQVLRNVELAGTSIDGTKEDELPGIVAELAADLGARKVTITSGDLVYESTAAELGLRVDEDATVDAAMDAGRGSAIFLRPFEWVGSFFSSRKVDLDLTVTDATTAETLQRLQGADHLQPVEPQIQLTGNGFTVVPGEPGTGIDAEQVASDLLATAQDSPGGGTIEIVAEPQEQAPNFSDEQAQALADRANEMTADGLTLKAGDTSTTVPAQTLRGWLSQTVTDGQLDLAFNADAAKQALPTLLAGVNREPKNATVEMGPNGQPRVVEAQNGIACCDESSADLIWQALREGKGEVELETTVTEPEWTTEEVEAWKVVGPVGGNRGWRDGHDLTEGQPPGFTTYHPAGQARVHNIHKIADDVRGAVIPPGGEFSINDHVGRRTYEKGYVDAGAIRNGLHVEEVGGGISQFATTMFNAAFFAGFDILEYQTHSEYFSRYPPGREATMGIPGSGPDLRIRNNSPYGVLIWTSYTDTSITVTFYSSPYARGEQTAITERMNGVCRIVTTTRTRTFPDGSTKQDTFTSQPYRPEGKRCDGSEIPPPPPETPGPTRPNG